MWRTIQSRIGFKLYERDITSFLIYYTGSMDVEDLVQETFMIAMKKMSDIQRAISSENMVDFDCKKSCD